LSLFWPTRPAARRRLFTGAAIVAASGLLTLMPIDLGAFGNPAPLTILWAACGWTSLGPSPAAGVLLLLLGLWLDMLTGGPPGGWALVALCAHAGLLVQSRWMALQPPGPVWACAIVALMALAIAIVINLVRGSPAGALAMLAPSALAVVGYAWAHPLFTFDEDEA
jgi:hypothetical protein